MATTYSFTKCPNCNSEECMKTVDKGEMRWESAGKTCGYRYYAILKRAENGKVMVRDQALGTEEWDNIIKQVEFDRIKCDDRYYFNFPGGFIRSGTFSSKKELRLLIKFLNFYELGELCSSFQNRFSRVQKLFASNFKAGLFLLFR